MVLSHNENQEAGGTQSRGFSTISVLMRVHQQLFGGCFWGQGGLQGLSPHKSKKQEPQSESVRGWEELARSYRKTAWLVMKGERETFFPG